MPPASAPATGASNGPQNAVATSRRSRSEGHMMSASVARAGRAAASTTSTGSAAYAAETADSQTP